MKVPLMFNQFLQHVLATNVVRELIEEFPTVYEISEDFYWKVILPTLDDISVLVEKFIALPVVDFTETLTQYWAFIEAEVIPMFNKFILRLPDAKFVKDMKTQYPTVFEVQELLNELKSQYPAAYATTFDFYFQVIVPAYSDLVAIYGKLIKISDVYQLRELLKTEGMMFIKKLQKNISNTSFMKFVILEFYELLDSSPAENQLILKIYKEISQITVSDILATVKSYINEKLGITYSISTEKFTAVVPAPVSVATVRYFYHVYVTAFHIYAPEYVADFFVQGRILYRYIQARIPVIVDYINTQTPIYLQYIKNNFEKLQVINIQNAQTNLSYFRIYKSESLPQLFFDTLGIAVNSFYGRFIGKKLIEIFELLELKLKEVMKIFPVFIPLLYRIDDILEMFILTFLGYVIWTIKVIVAPLAHKINYYTIYFTPGKAQAIAISISEFVMSTLSQMMPTIATVTQEIPAFIQMHIPAFILSFIASILSYLN